MKVILKQDVAKIGKKHNIVEVPNGYAMNTLIPNGKALPATQQNIKAIEQIKQRANLGAQASLDIVKTIVEQMGDKPLEVLVETNEKNQMFQTLNNKFITDAGAKIGIEIPETLVEIPEPIKEVGTFTVNLIAGEEKFPLQIAVIKK